MKVTTTQTHPKRKILLEYILAIKEIEFIVKLFQKKKNTPQSQTLSVAKWNGGELALSGTQLKHITKRPCAMSHTVYCRQNVAELWPAYTFSYPRAKYFSSRRIGRFRISNLSYAIVFLRHSLKRM